MLQIPQLDADASSPVTMKNREWQSVLSVLRQGPYEVVAPLIERIIVSCIQHAQMPNEPRNPTSE